MAKALTHFSITPAEDGYTLHLEDEDGETTEFFASYEQLDVIAEAIDDQLDKDADEYEEVEEGEGEEE